MAPAGPSVMQWLGWPTTMVGNVVGVVAGNSAGDPGPGDPPSWGAGLWTVEGGTVGPTVEVTVLRADWIGAGSGGAVVGDGAGGAAGPLVAGGPPTTGFVPGVEAADCDGDVPAAARNSAGSRDSVAVGDAGNAVCAALAGATRSGAALTGGGATRPATVVRPNVSTATMIVDRPILAVKPILADLGTLLPCTGQSIARRD